MFCVHVQIESLVKTDEKRTRQWEAFKAWLEEHGPFDVVIDAANVGYFNQNYEGCVFQFVFSLFFHLQVLPFPTNEKNRM